MGLQDNLFPKLLARAEGATTVLTNAELLGVAATPEEGEEWTQLCNNHKYNTYSSASPPGARATVCRQHQDAMGLEVYRQICKRFAIPVGTRSIGYITKLLDPKWNKKRIPHKTSRTKIRQQQL